MAAWVVFSSLGSQLVRPRLYVALLRFMLLHLSSVAWTVQKKRWCGQTRTAHLLSGGQTVLGCAQDAADEAELLKSELGCFRALLFFEEAADGQSSTAAGGSREKEWELVRQELLIICFLNRKLRMLRQRKMAGQESK
jgi:hypothetical protein